MTDLYKPWIQPLRHNEQLLLPWIPDDTEVATEMVGAWAAAMHRMQDLFHGALILGVFWVYDTDLTRSLIECIIESLLTSLM